MVAALATLGLAGCFSEDDSTPDAGEMPTDPAPSLPRFMLPESITGMEFTALVDENSTSGIWLHEGHAYLSGASGLRIFNIANPEQPVLVAADIENTTGTRDVDILEHPNGRTYAVLAHGGARMTFVDVTDPRTPVVVQQVTNIGSAHNIAVVPNSTIVYNSISLNTGHVGDVLGGAAPPGAGWIDVVDVADMDAPQVKRFVFPPVITTPAGAPKAVSSVSCHDMTFHVGRQLGYCAGITDTQIWDISDPWNPAIIQVIDWPAVNIHHGVWATQDGDMLILGDELVGVIGVGGNIQGTGSPAVYTPGCGNNMPTSALWFFDVSNIETPLPVGYYQVSHDAIGASVEGGELQYCSTHFGTLIEDRPMMAIGLYTAGTALIDFTDPQNVVEVDLYTQPGTNTWEARYYNGHVYTGDTGRGMEILRLV